MKVVRDVRERGRDIEGCIKQWFAFVKPNFHKYVEVQRDVAGAYLAYSIGLSSNPSRYHSPAWYRKSGGNRYDDHLSVPKLILIFISYGC